MSKIDNYNKIEAVNNTALSYLKKSPAHYKAFLEGKTKSTEPMRIGIALHEAILEPEKFENNFEIKLENKGEGIRAKMQEQKERCKENGVHLVSKIEFDMFKGIAETLHKDSFITELLSNAKIEHSLTWEYKSWKCKGRLDGIVPNMAIFDCKFVADADPKYFTKKAFYYGYHRQAFWYKQGAIANNLINKNCPYYIIAVEKVSPFAYSIIEIGDSVIEEGKREADMLLDKLKELKETQKYDFYGHYQWETEQYETEAQSRDLENTLNDFAGFFN